jgi:hypothetical protein
VKNAASQITGQTFFPNKTNEAIAMPVGAHIGVALSFTVASESPMIPVIKYARKTQANLMITGSVIIFGSYLNIQHKANKKHRLW